jgi:hypothetical protein
VYWAGTTIALARDEMRAEKFFPSQMRSAGLVMLTGALLWYFFHGAYFGSMETVLAIGVVAAFAAALVLRSMVGSAWRQLPGVDATEQTRLRAKMLRGERIAAGLLVVTVVCMATARMI